MLKMVNQDRLTLCSVITLFHIFLFCSLFIKSLVLAYKFFF